MVSAGLLLLIASAIVAVAVNIFSNWLPSPRWLTTGRAVIVLVCLVALGVAIAVVQQWQTGPAESGQRTASSDRAKASVSPTARVSSSPPKSRSTRATTKPPTSAARDGGVTRTIRTTEPVTGPTSVTATGTGDLSFTTRRTFAVGESIPVEFIYRNSTGHTIQRPILDMELYSASCLTTGDVLVEETPGVLITKNSGGLNGKDCVVTLTADAGDAGQPVDLSDGNEVKHAISIRLEGPDNVTTVNLAVGVYNGSTGGWYTSIKTIRLTRT
jgi:cytoskeletal protein RodZ